MVASRAGSAVALQLPLRSQEVFHVYSYLHEAMKFWLCIVIAVSSSLSHEILAV